jgi:Flp pilus assembly protein TadB
MAQTKRKRRSKHRGNAAGQVEARGRTSRPSGERKRQPAAKPRDKAEARSQARERRLERYDVEPTWASSGKKAAIMAALFGVVLGVIGRNIPGALAGAGLMVLLYLPLTYYTDRFFYNRRQRQKQRGQR